MLKLYAAQVGLKAADFNKCLDDKKYQDQITQLAAEGQSFGINSTPSIFIGSDLQVATAKYDDLKKIIDEQLAQ
jgi:protein-disulfide isomerase